MYILIFLQDIVQEGEFWSQKYLLDMIEFPSSWKVYLEFH